jgi:hypothetical protein
MLLMNQPFQMLLMNPMYHLYLMFLKSEMLLKNLPNLKNHLNLMFLMFH